MDSALYWIRNVHCEVRTEFTNIV